ncbi:MAG TPA: phosphotransferase [Propionibacteriaceae bacterium]|jgi:aminoglycoside phosphotransferase (APT) family kinase protein
MDRVDGPTMADQLAEHPEQAEPLGRLLADLHRALDRTRSRGSALVDGDLHPDNVLMSAEGPVLFDWTNQRTGPRALDVALTWLMLGCFNPDDDALRAHLAPLRAEFLRCFLEAVDAGAAAAALPEAAMIRRADASTTFEEHSRIDRLVRVSAS